jgi:NADH dehydrogenase (ubiquinone) 1 beta subcomplex subunit 10
MATRSTNINFKKVPDYPRNEDGCIDRSDPVALYEARGQRVRERLIAIEQTKIIREKLRDCYHKEGVNHYENCREIAQAYIERIQAPNFGAPVSNIFSIFHLSLLSPSDRIT